MWLVTLVMTGCVASKVDEKLVKESAARQVEIDSLLAEIETTPQKSISWGEAHRRLVSENLGLRQSRQMLVQAESESRRQWLTLVPRIAGFLNISKGLTALADIESDNFNANVVGSFNIPNPFEFYGALYGAELQAQNARWSHEMDERRAYTELYTAFLDAKALSEETAALERRRRNFAVEDSTDITKAIYSLAKERAALERRMMAHRGSVNRLFNTPGGNWNLTGGLPVVSYKDRYRNIRIGKDFGKMALNLYAVRIESSIMQTQRVKYQQWPSIGFGISNPPIYSSSGSDGLSGEDFNLFSGANKSLDVTDIGGRQAVQNAETRLKFTREQLLLNMERETVRILQIQENYGQLLADERRLKTAIKRLNRPGSSEAEAVLGDLESLSKLELQLIQTRRQMEQLDLQYLIWDERFWKS